MLLLQVDLACFTFHLPNLVLLTRGLRIKVISVHTFHTWRYHAWYSTDACFLTKRIESSVLIDAPSSREEKKKISFLDNDPRISHLWGKHVETIVEVIFHRRVFSNKANRIEHRSHWHFFILKKKERKFFSWLTTREYLTYDEKHVEAIVEVIFHWRVFSNKANRIEPNIVFIDASSSQKERKKISFLINHRECLTYHEKHVEAIILE